MSMTSCLKLKCDYYFNISSKNIITNNNIIQNLIENNLDIIAPLFKSNNSPWSNFWGDITNKGYYKRSWDYIDIIDNKKKGCWNVPYINETYMITHNKLKTVATYHVTNLYKGLDVDMLFCYNCRINGIFMYIDNTYVYGNNRNN